MRRTPGANNRDFGLVAGTQRTKASREIPRNGGGRENHDIYMQRGREREREWEGERDGERDRGTAHHHQKRASAMQEVVEF